MEGAGVRVHDEVRCARPDPETLVVGNRGVDRVQPQEQVGHRGTVPKGGRECVRAHGLAAQGAVHVRESQQHKLDIVQVGWDDLRGDLGRRARGSVHSAHCRLAAAPLSFFSILLVMCAIVSVKRSMIIASSWSVLVNAGAIRISSPA